MTKRDVLSKAAIVAILLFAPGPTPDLQAQNRGVSQQRVTDLRRDGAPARVDAIVQRFARRVAEALDLDETEYARLETELLRTREARETVNLRRRQVRRELSALVRRDDADVGRVAGLLDELDRLNREFASIGPDESRRLAEFLTPLQRARLIYLQEQLVRRAQQARATDGGRPR